MRVPLYIISFHSSLSYFINFRMMLWRNVTGASDVVYIFITASVSIFIFDVKII